MEILKPIISIPLEREYEGWIVRSIEKYFLKINKKVRVVAISPKHEKVFPADDVFKFELKLIGIQFKRPALSKRKIPCCSNLKWKIDNQQHQILKSFNFIYYCLPTFINRNFKENSLHHSLFWRPDNNEIPTEIWYNKPGAKNKDFKNLNSTAMRWGTFVEKILCCSIGELIPKGKKGKIVLTEIFNGIELTKEREEVIYAFLIEL